ncbi:NAD(P)/FAD-dependent oxidoreductase [Oscillatoria laete-virens NRMC-F 0139]|nr:NAD(P)/FAD-dependent oxidoreductase [Oscillatoria laete-virens]MDL5052311.1 NAD(P)/FAD-dependent oxidoreductase [Oscillatoria laete-virens NRMC-F 0139]
MGRNDRTLIVSPHEHKAFLPVKEKSVLIIGAGLAGLACALTLRRNGVNALIVEAADRPGGRVRSDFIEGFLLDRGFQVWLDSYPEGLRFLPNVTGGRFISGAQIRAGNRFHCLCDPWREPSSFLESAFSPLATFADKLRLQFLLWRNLRGDLSVPAEMTAMDFLRREGFSEKFISSFWRPFYGGVFLEKNLETPAPFFLFTLRMFASGHAMLPHGGMAALPARLAKQIAPENLRLNCPVTQIAPGEVTLSSGETIHTDKIVVATDGRTACKLLGLSTVLVFRETICAHFAAPHPPYEEPILTLDSGPESFIQTLSVQSNVNPGYAPAGQALICLSVVPTPAQMALDDAAIESKLRTTCEAWFGAAVNDWRLLRIDRIRDALPECGAGEKFAPLLEEKSRTGIELSGDWLESPSLNGALASGRKTAEKIMISFERGADH